MSGLIGITPPPPNASEGQTSAQNQDLVFDTNEQDFASQVMEASMEHPILVDFWAPWCGPCRSLAPILEKVVHEVGGAVKLAKLNTDENQALAGQLRIQSLPTVYAFFQGRPIDGFNGALPETEIRAFVDKIIQATGASPADTGDLHQTLEQALACVESGDLAQAEGIALELMSVAGDRQEVVVLMGKVLLAQEKSDELEALLEGLDEKLVKMPEIRALQASISLSKEAEGLPNLTQLRAVFDAQGTPKEGDQQAAFDLARGLLAAGEHEEGASLLLTMFKAQPDWNQGAARQKLLNLFEAYGPADPFTIKIRRRLSALLYS